jgi:hypothetical protein
VHTAKWRGKQHRQFNTLCNCKVQREKQCFTNMAKAEHRTINLFFDLPSSQDSNNGPSPHPKLAKSKKLRNKKGGGCRRWEVVKDDNEEEEEDDGGNDDGNNRGGKRGNY